MINPEQPVFSDHPVAPSRGDSREPQPSVDLPPLVSVIAAVSARELRALGPTIKSLGLQTLRRWELIVAAVDSPKTRSAPRPAVRSSDPRVRLLPGGFPTAGAARAQAVAAASAEALAFLSSGDLLEPTALEKLFLAFACSDGRQLLTSFRVQFGADPALHGDAHLYWEERIRRREVPTYFWLMSRALHDEAAGFDPTLSDPESLWDFWRKAAAVKGRLRAIPEFLHWHKAAAGSTAAHERRRRAFERIPAAASAPTVEATPAPPTTPLPANTMVRSGRHILVLHPFFIPGGAERVLINELTDLLAKGWGATVIATDRTYQSWLHNFTRVTPDVFVAHHLLDPEGLLDKRPPDQYRDQWLRLLNYFLDSRAPDLLLISNSTLGFASVPYLKITRPSLPVVTLRHSADWPAPPCDTDAMADLTIATSRSVVDGLVAKGRAPERIALHYSGIDLAKWRAYSPQRAASRQALGIGPETPLILLVSRMSWEKGPDLALRVLERLAEQGSPFRAVWAGSGPLMDASRRFLEDKGLNDRVRLLGGVDDPTLHSLFAAADVFLLTSRQEGIPLSILDAFANGLPVVVSAVGGVPELLGDEYEQMVEMEADEARTVEAFCRHLQTLLVDAALRQRLGSQGLKLVEARFDRRHAGARFEALLQQALLAHAQAPITYDSEPVARFAIAMAASESLSRSAWIETKSEAALLRGLLALTPAAPPDETGESADIGAHHDAPRTATGTTATTRAKE